MKLSSIALVGAAAAAALVGLYVWRKGGIQAAAAGIASGAVGAAGDVASGAVLGVGDAVGIPRTDMTECERAMAEGRTWDASFACPAKTFLDYVWSGAPAPYDETERLARRYPAPAEPQPTYTPGGYDGGGTWGWGAA